jgi:hypothetical protein
MVDMTNRRRRHRRQAIQPLGRLLRSRRVSRQWLRRHRMGHPAHHHRKTHKPPLCHPVIPCIEMKKIVIPWAETAARGRTPRRRDGYDHKLRATRFRDTRVTNAL